MAVKTSLNPTGGGYVPSGNFVWNQKTLGRRMGTGVNSMQNYYQQYLQQMQQAQGWQQQQAAQAQKQAQGYIEQLSPKIEGYLNQMQGNYEKGLSAMQKAGGDSSYLKQAWNMARQGVANPGWGDQTVRQMKNAASAQGSAQQASATRQLERSMSGRGMAGPAADYLKAALKNRFGMQTAAGLRNVDVNAATYAADSKKQYMGMAGQYAGDLARMGQQNQTNLANYYQSYNPLNWLQQTQSILSPLQTIGYGAGQGAAW